MASLFGADKQGSRTVGMDALVQSHPLGCERKHPAVKTVFPVGTGRNAFRDVGHTVCAIPFRQTGECQHMVQSDL